MTVVFAIAGIAVVIAVGLLAVGRLGELPPAPLDRAPVDLPSSSLTADDVDSVLFGVGLRGYRMDEVDAVLSRVADDLASRDDRIEQLEAELLSRGLSLPQRQPDGSAIADAAPRSDDGQDQQWST